jgi:hypothetical protein
MGAPPVVIEVALALALVDERRSELTAMKHRLAATAESIAGVMEGLARTRDKLAGNTRGDPGPLHDSARRAREFAATERQEADRLHRSCAAAPGTSQIETIPEGDSEQLRCGDRRR